MRIAIGIVSLVLAACGGSSSSGGSIATAQVTLTATGVSPASANVASGGSLKFVNNDTVAHQIASSNCSELASPSLAAGASFTAQFGPGPKTCNYDDSLNPSTAAFSGTVNVASPGMPGY